MAAFCHRTYVLTYPYGHVGGGCYAQLVVTAEGVAYEGSCHEEKLTLGLGS